MARKNIYDPKDKKPFKLSRTKIDLFVNCPRCFYLDRRLGVSRPPMFPYSLNQAVDTLLKKEFDILRKKGEAHSLMKKYKIDAVPYQHENIDDWRNNWKGIQYFDKSTNFVIFGAIDDIWINPHNELHIVDYKSTSTTQEISMDSEYRQGYKRQAEIYQWIFRKNNFKISDIAYFVYCNGKTGEDKFDGILEFDIQILDYKGNDSWVEATIKEAKKCLDSDKAPQASPGCIYCQYRAADKKLEK
ncbi:MAG: PD-(D/E)XK nuclease family protein [Candidatus Pacebacteria bacterium]|nr:PD-(D/E)XK nuclease family protein [Candidatus Paceibacterota bacterium]MDD5721733.1 PD-(D/E)XK nuclease family protein [Candidatus Paceibacterota bacterium]